MSQDAYNDKVIELGRHLRVLFDRKIDDAAELKRQGRVFLGIPSRLKKVSA